MKVEKKKLEKSQIEFLVELTYEEFKPLVEKAAEETDLCRSWHASHALPERVRVTSLGGIWNPSLSRGIVPSRKEVA